MIRELHERTSPDVRFCYEFVVFLSLFFQSVKLPEHDGETLQVPYHPIWIYGHKKLTPSP